VVFACRWKKLPVEAVIVSIAFFYDGGWIAKGNSKADFNGMESILSMSGRLQSGLPSSMYLTDGIRNHSRRTFSLKSSLARCEHSFIENASDEAALRKRCRWRLAESCPETCPLFVILHHSSFLPSRLPLYSRRRVGVTAFPLCETFVVSGRTRSGGFDQEIRRD